MFIVISLCMLTDQSQMDDNCRPLLQEYAVQLGLDMFALIANRCLRLLREHIQSGEPQVSNIMANIN